MEKKTWFNSLNSEEHAELPLNYRFIEAAKKGEKSTESRKFVKSKLHQSEKFVVKVFNKPISRVVFSLPETRNE